MYIPKLALKDHSYKKLCDFFANSKIGLSRVYSDRQLNSDSHLVCFIVQLLE